MAWKFFSNCFLYLDIQYRKHFEALKALEKSKKHFFLLSKYAQFAFKFVPVIAQPKSLVILESDVTLCTSMQHQIWQNTQSDVMNNFSGNKLGPSLWDQKIISKQIVHILKAKKKCFLYFSSTFKALKHFLQISNYKKQEKNFHLFQQQLNTFPFSKISYSKYEIK